MKSEIVQYFKSLQDSICTGLEQLDGQAKFHEDQWSRDGGGGGRSRVIREGNVFEKGGVNFSEVFGKAPSFLSKEPAEFYATGVSLVIHPANPHVPIIHMNVRYLSVVTASGSEKSWFGGGIDMTPIYVVEEEARQFHRALKAACDPFHQLFYPEFKKWADDYFFIPHRSETRGVGGIFFDHLDSPSSGSLNHGLSIEKIFEFVQAVGNTFLKAYSPIVATNKERKFTDREKKWQLIRRGRYAEFNLVYDRGTKFGLETNGRTESILMSLPPQANWEYNFIPESGSEEERTTYKLKKGIDWIL